jgi:hypothetical protein
MNIALPSITDIVDFSILIGMAAFVALVCFFLFRSKPVHHHKHQHHRRRRSQRKLNPTLAQTGGLPPRREEKKSDDPTPTP